MCQCQVIHMYQQMEYFKIIIEICKKKVYNINIQSKYRNLGMNIPEKNRRVISNGKKRILL